MRRIHDDIRQAETEIKALLSECGKGAQLSRSAALWALAEEGVAEQASQALVDIETWAQRLAGDVAGLTD